MALPSGLAGLLLLVLLVLAPPLLLVWRIRSVERARREPWRSVRQAFLWGALAATLASLLLAPVLDRWLVAWLGATVVPLGIVVVAPVVEEIAKAAGLVGVRDDHIEAEDGLILGAASGMGFAATENALYVTTAFFLAGPDAALATAIFRGLATVGLHGAATAISGWGIWRARAHVSGAPLAVAALGGAILLHAAYNALVTFAESWAAVLAVAVGLTAYALVERRVRALDGAVIPS